jgi:hypothetical protein
MQQACNEIVGTAHIKSGAGHSQSSRFHFAKQRPGKHVPTAMKLAAFQHQQYAYPWKWSDWNPVNVG